MMRKRPARLCSLVGELQALEPRVLLSGVTGMPGYRVVAPHGSMSIQQTTSPQGYSPAFIRNGYGLAGLTFGSVPADGTGQTIAIIDAFDDPTIRDDLHAFDQAFGLPDPTLTIVAQDGSTNLPPVDPAGPGHANFEGEVALDVEWAHAMAPGASILLAESNDATLTNIFAAVDYARHVPGVSVISMSLGAYEYAAEGQWDSLFSTPAGHTPITFVASTGDAGTPGGVPGYSPGVLAVGGTTLNLDPAGNYVDESGWSFTGGGISQFEAKPSYQDGFVNGAFRGIPDVAFDADPNTGVAIYDSYNNGVATPWQVIGGTSLGAPAWAGLIAVANQGRVLAGEATLDSTADTLPLIYKAPDSVFHDITTGSNGTSAGPGYDLVTGRGSPRADLLIPYLVSGPVVTPPPPPPNLYAPFGVLDVVSATQVAGWTIDPDTATSSVMVQLNVDGFAFNTLPASVSRPDLTPIYGSPAHGFSFDISTLTPGVHRFDLFAIDTSTGSLTQIGGSRTVNTNRPPIGWVDFFDGRQFAGWAYDSNAGAASIQIQYSVDGKGLTVTTASLTRPDLATALGSTDHGFSISLPQLTAGTHILRVYVMDSTTGQRVLIGLRRAVVTNLPGNPLPIGSLDIVSNSRIAGWAWDASTPGAALMVRIDIDGVAGVPFTLDVVRSDVSHHVRSSGTFGFDRPLALSPGSHRIDFYAIDAPGGTVVLIDSRRTA